MTAVTGGRGPPGEDSAMDRRPVLELYVTRGCAACKRAERALRGCDLVLRVADLVVFELGGDGISHPAAVVGGPTVVLDGVVVALGTPDCAELAARLEALIAASS